MLPKKQGSPGGWRATKPYSMRKRGARKRPRKLLVVDDDIQVLHVARRILEKEWEIYTARTASEAAEMIKTNCFDTVLSDFEMPGRDGIWLLSEVKRLWPTTRRVLFSGSQPTGLAESLQSGVVECFLPKPSSRDELTSSLEA